MNVLKLILVALDDPIRPTPASRRAVELARRTGAKLHLCMTVFDWSIDAASDMVDKKVGQLARKEFLDLRQQALAEYAAEQTASGLDVDFEVIWSGKPHDALLARVLDLRPDLVVKDVVRESLLGRWSTVRSSDWKLVRQCPAPLMLTRKSSVLLPKRIAVAVDPVRSESSVARLDERAMRAAVPIAMVAEAELQLVHVCKRRGRQLGDGHAINDYLDMLRKEDNAAYVDFAQHMGVPEENRVLLEGEAHHELLKFVESANVDLMVIGSEYRTGFERFMIGSTAEALISGSDCDLLLVRPDGFAETLQQYRDLEELRELYRGPQTA